MILVLKEQQQRYLDEQLVHLDEPTTVGLTIHKRGDENLTDMGKVNSGIITVYQPREQSIQMRAASREMFPRRLNC